MDAAPHAKLAGRFREDPSLARVRVAVSTEAREGMRCETTARGHVAAAEFGEHLIEQRLNPRHVLMGRCWNGTRGVGAASDRRWTNGGRGFGRIRRLRFRGTNSDTRRDGWR